MPSFWTLYFHVCIIPCKSNKGDGLQKILVQMHHIHSINDTLDSKRNRYIVRIKEHCRSTSRVQRRWGLWLKLWLEPPNGSSNTKSTPPKWTYPMKRHYSKGNFIFQLSIFRWGTWFWGVAEFWSEPLATFQIKTFQMRGGSNTCAWGTGVPLANLQRGGTPRDAGFTPWAT